MNTFATYKTLTGEITSIFTGADRSIADNNVEADESVYVGEANESTHWIDPATGQRRDRDVMVPDTVTAPGEATISNIPDPCTVIWGEQKGQATGGEVTITFDEPGIKQLVLSASPQYLDHELEIEIL